MTTLQVTIGAGATQIGGANVFVRQVIFQNNAAHSMRIGDANVSSTRGALLSVGSPGGSLNLGPFFAPSIDLSTFYVAGTQNDVLDIIFIQ